MFFEISNERESAYEDETEGDSYRSSLKQRNNWQSTNNQKIWCTSENNNCCMNKKKILNSWFIVCEKGSKTI